MSDLISRQAAIEALTRLANDPWNQETNASWAAGFSEAAYIIENLPSAQPLIDAICPHYIRNEHDRGDDSLCRKFQCEVSALPRKTGKWIDETVTTGTTSGATTIIRQYRCSVCGNLFGRIDDRFCGKCGARMEEQDEAD